MTIYTAEQALNPEKKDNHDDCYEVEIQMPDEKKALTAETGADDYVVYKATTVPVVGMSRAASIHRQRQIRRRNIWLLPLLLLGMILGVTLCIFGSLQLWNGMYYTSDDSEYRGRCGVGLMDMSKYNRTDNPQALKSTSLEGKKVDYVEDVDIKGNLETMTVPKRGNSSVAVVRNDFDKNFTAIRDDLREICLLVPFLKSFISTMVPSPANFSLYLQKIEREGETPLVYEQEAYFKTVSHVSDMSDYGVPLAELCEGLKTFRTEPVAGTATTLPPTTTQPPTTPVYSTDDWLADFGLDEMLYSMYPGGDALYNYHFSHPMFDNDFYESYPDW